MRISNFTTVALIFISGLMISCSGDSEYGEPNVNPDDVQKSFMNWWTYHNENIHLSEDFVALNSSSKVIDKGEFLKSLTTGVYIPLELQTEDSLTYYQLFKLHKDSDKNIGQVLKSSSATDYKHYRMEGKKFPDFEFTDLEGNVYTNTNTRGKTILLKTWFINCKPCIDEMPNLNELVEKYENRDDVLFISLALDSAEDLQDFLSKREFDYAVVPDQYAFINNTLNVGIFPTHIVIEEDGTIKKVMNTYDDLMAVIGEERPTKSELEKSVPPPPPPPPPAAPEGVMD